MPINPAVFSQRMAPAYSAGCFQDGEWEIKIQTFCLARLPLPIGSRGAPRPDVELGFGEKLDRKLVQEISSTGLRAHTTASGRAWRRFPGLNDPFPLKRLKSAFTAISGEMTF